MLARILELAPGVTASKNRFEVAEHHRLTLYIGEPGQAMVVPEVAACVFEDGFLRVETRDTGTHLFFEYAAVHGVSDRPPAASAGARRAGFS